MVVLVFFLLSRQFEPRREKTGFFAYAKTKTQISFAVTAKLISAFVFAVRIEQPLYFLNPKFQASSHLLWLYSPVCVGPGRKPRRPVFSERGSFRVEPDQKTLIDRTEGEVEYLLILGNFILLTIQRRYF